MTTSTPWLSILMPTFNGEDYLAQALDSVAAENDPGIECLVIDGGSGDRTVEMAASYGERLTIRLYEKPESPNWVWSTNFALNEAQAPYATLLHQDDYWFPGRAALLKDLTRQHPDAGLYVHDVHFVDDDARILGRLSCPWPSAPRVVERDKALHHLLVQNFISCPAPVFPAETARRVGGMDPSLWYTADWDFWLKLVCEGPVHYINKPLSAFRIHGASQTVTGSRNVSDFREQLDLVTSRYADALPPGRQRDKILRAARFSNRVNASLAAKFHGHRVDWMGLSREALSLGFGGLRRYLRDSRIVSRSMVRVRAGLAGQWAAAGNA